MSSNQRRARILATLGPATSSRERIAALLDAGANVFRLNFSHGTHEDHAARFRIIRELEAERGQPIGIVQDLQGPKLRVGAIEGGKVMLAPGQRFRLDLDPALGIAQRDYLPIPRFSRRWSRAPTCCWTMASCACALTPSARTSPIRR